MLIRLLRSLLSEPGAVEFIVIDQSAPAAPGLVEAPLPEDPRLRYFRSATRGKGAALNEGLRLAQGEIVVCTDDDCEAKPGWAQAFAAVLLAEPRGAVAFCNVAAAPFDPALGFIPTFEPKRDRVVRSLALLRRPGLGAGMALRRSAVLELGGFDESFGPGSHFPSCDDWDIAVRAVLRGWWLCEVAGISITHHGFRNFLEGREHARRDWTALGAACAKPLLAGYPSAAPLAAWTFLRHAVFPPFSELVRLRRPHGLVRITSFLRGFIEGLRTRVDPKTLRFLP